MDTTISFLSQPVPMDCAEQPPPQNELDTMAWRLAQQVLQRPDARSWSCDFQGTNWTLTLLPNYLLQLPAEMCGILSVGQVKELINVVLATRPYPLGGIDLRFSPLSTTQLLELVKSFPQLPCWRVKPERATEGTIEYLILSFPGSCLIVNQPSLFDESEFFSASQELGPGASHQISPLKVLPQISEEAWLFVLANRRFPDRLEHLCSHHPGLVLQVVSLLDYLCIGDLAKAFDPILRKAIDYLDLSADRLRNLLDHTRNLGLTQSHQLLRTKVIRQLIALLRLPPMPQSLHPLLQSFLSLFAGCVETDLSKIHLPLETRVIRNLQCLIPSCNFLLFYPSEDPGALPLLREFPHLKTVTFVSEIDTSCIDDLDLEIRYHQLPLDPYHVEVTEGKATYFLSGQLSQAPLEEVGKVCQRLFGNTCPRLSINPCRLLAPGLRTDSLKWAFRNIGINRASLLWDFWLVKKIISGFTTHGMNVELCSMFGEWGVEGNIDHWLEIWENLKEISLPYDRAKLLIPHFKEWSDLDKLTVGVNISNLSEVLAVTKEKNIKRIAPYYFENQTDVLPSHVQTLLTSKKRIVLRYDVLQSVPGVVKALQAAPDLEELELSWPSDQISAPFGESLANLRKKVPVKFRCNPQSLDFSKTAWVPAANRTVDLND